MKFCPLVATAMNSIRADHPTSALNSARAINTGRTAILNTQASSEAKPYYSTAKSESSMSALPSVHLTILCGGEEYPAFRVLLRFGEMKNGASELPSSLNLPFIEALYADYVRDPASVMPEWRHYFEGIENGDR